MNDINIHQQIVDWVMAHMEEFTDNQLNTIANAAEFELMDRDDIDINQVGFQDRPESKL